MEKICPECGERVVGRSDKIYCCDMCRNAYNNKLRREGEKSARPTNNILLRNMRILIQYDTKGCREIPVKELLVRKFDFNHYTYRTNGLLRRYYYCYNYKYYISSRGVVRIVNNSEKALPLSAF